MEPTNVLALLCFDVFAENDNGPATGETTTPASSVSSSVRPGDVRTPPVVELPHDVGLYVDLNWKEEMLDDHESGGLSALLASDKHRRG